MDVKFFLCSLRGKLYCAANCTLGWHPLSRWDKKRPDSVHYATGVADVSLGLRRRALPQVPGMHATELQRSSGNAGARNGTEYRNSVCQFNCSILNQLTSQQYSNLWLNSSGLKRSLTKLQNILLDRRTNIGKIEINPIFPGNDIADAGEDIVVQHRADQTLR